MSNEEKKFCVFCTEIVDFNEDTFDIVAKRKLPNVFGATDTETYFFSAHAACVEKQIDELELPF